jgi:hypothetical protein
VDRLAPALRARVSAKLGAVEVAPAAARGRDAALASQLRVRTDQDRDDGEEQTEAEGLHGGQYRAGLRPGNGEEGHGLARLGR